ncbi:MAG: CFI-box-CTERM domain-containing protein [Velocimicrobium sp.]
MERTFDYDENMQYALEGIGSVLLDNTKLMEKFKKKSYGDAFQEYKEKSYPIFESMQRACTVREEQKTDIIDACVKRALDDFEASMESMNKTKKNSYLENCKMVLALYTIPMILDLRMELSEEYTDHFIEKWIEKYPKHVFRKGTYESLVEGFVKKGFCYITTAVCEMKNKSDDCYELMMFRGFRDDFLMKDKDGKSLVKEYYEVAPRILAAIELKPKKEEIYQDIWENHLSICLANLEKGEDDLCKNNYKKMVKSLENRYIS